MFSYELMSDGKYHRVELLAVKTNFTLRVDGGLARYIPACSSTFAFFLKYTVASAQDSFPDLLIFRHGSGSRDNCLILN
jgi:hypothetical protein